MRSHPVPKIAEHWASLLIFDFCIRLDVKLDGWIGHNHRVKLGSLSF